MRLLLLPSARRAWCDLWPSVLRPAAYLPDLNPKQAYYPERERESSQNQRAASDRFTNPQLLRAGELRTAILNPGNR